MKKILSLFAVLACLAAFSADIIVHDGKSTEQAFFHTRSKWTETPAGLTGTGIDNPVMAANVYRPGAFDVEIVLSLAELNATASRVRVGDAVCGIDNGEHKFFVEGANGTRVLCECAGRIEPGKPFTLRIRGESGTLSYYVNGELIGEYGYSTDGPLVSMYTRKAGKQTFRLPRKVEVAVDLFTGEVLAKNARVVNFDSPEAPHTRVIFAGRVADYEKFFAPKEKR